MNLEDNILLLEKIVKKMETESLSIEDSLKIYEDAILLAQKCLNAVSHQKGRLTELTKDLEKINLEENETIN